MYYCYFLVGHKKKTYIGSTNNLYRRIRQHNGIIKGGAKRTRAGRPYDYWCIIGGDVSHSFILKLEWRLHHPDGKRRRSGKWNRIEGRINSIIEVFINNKQWRAKIKKTKALFVLWIKEDLISKLNFLKFSKNVIIQPF